LTVGIDETIRVFNRVNGALANEKNLDDPVLCDFFDRRVFVALVRQIHVICCVPGATGNTW